MMFAAKRGSKRSIDGCVSKWPPIALGARSPAMCYWREVMLSRNPKLAIS